VRVYGSAKSLPQWSPSQGLPRSARNQFPIKLVSAMKTNSADYLRCVSGACFMNNNPQVVLTPWASTRSVTGHFNPFTNVLFHSRCKRVKVTAACQSFCHFSLCTADFSTSPNSGYNNLDEQVTGDNRRVRKKGHFRHRPKTEQCRCRHEAKKKVCGVG
jgi:hypothetical protein